MWLSFYKILSKRFPLIFCKYESMNITPGFCSEGSQYKSIVPLLNQKHISILFSSAYLFIFKKKFLFFVGFFILFPPNLDQVY